MKKLQIYEGMSSVQITNDLEKTAEQVIPGHVYLRKLSKEEIAEKNSKLNKNLKEISNLKEERKDIAAQIKQLNDEISEINDVVIVGAEQVQGKVYKILDPEQRKIYLINEEGFVVDESRMKKVEEVSLFNHKNKTM